MNLAGIDSNGTSTFNLQPSFANSDTEYEQNVSLFELLPFLRTCSLAIGFPLAKRTNNLLRYSTSSIRKMRRTGCLLLRLSRTPWELFVASKDIAGEEEAVLFIHRSPYTYIVLEYPGTSSKSKVFSRGRTG